MNRFGGVLLSLENSFNVFRKIIEYSSINNISNLYILFKEEIPIYLNQQNKKYHSELSLKKYFIICKSYEFATLREHNTNLLFLNPNHCDQLYPHEGSIVILKTPQMKSDDEEFLSKIFGKSKREIMKIDENSFCKPEMDVDECNFGSTPDFPLSSPDENLDTVVGGTFDRLHNGSKLLLSITSLFAMKNILIGVTSDDAVKDKILAEIIQPYEQRLNAVVEFIRLISPSTRIFMLIMLQPSISLFLL